MSRIYTDTRSPDYIRPVYVARRALAEAKITLFPVSVYTIMKHYGIRAMTYVNCCLANDMSPEECTSAYGKDGATVFKDGRFVIVYNDQITPKERIRFTIAHELGHILLRHHDELGVDMLQRFRVEKTLYEVMEEEANCFARNLLCPPLATADLLREHGIVANEYDEKQQRTVWLKVRSAPCRPEAPESITDFSLVQQAFRITGKAAKTRCHFLKQDLQNLSPKDRTAPYRIPHSAQWRCTRCGAPRHGGDLYCWHCGARNQFGFAGGHGAPALPAVHPYQDTHFRTCPFCGNVHMPSGSRFCMICGRPASNPCLPKGLSGQNPFAVMRRILPASRHLCDPGFRHCPTCGSLTLFSDHPDDDRFTSDHTNQGSGSDMNYGPRIPCDESTFKMTRCPRCLYEKHREEAAFCIMCGLNLYNSCEEGHRNPPDARFCFRCGKPTSLFRLSILKPYQEILKSNAAEARAEIESMGLSMDDPVEEMSSSADSAAVPETAGLPRISEDP